MLQAMTDALEDEGYAAVGVESGLAALEAARGQEFDLVVTDIRMEGMDGLETLQQLKQARPSLSSMVVTGYSSEADSLRAIRLGAGDYLKKPFSLSEFTARVGRLLQPPDLAEAGWELALRLLDELGRKDDRQALAEARAQGGLAAMAGEARRRGLGEAPAPRTPGALLTLGRALEATDPANARACYEEALAGDSAEQASARLGLARLTRDPAHALEALRLAGSGRRLLESALLLQDLRYPQAAHHLDEAAAHLTRRGDLAAAALAHLAKGSARDPALQILLQPQHGGELVFAAPWLLPRVLEEWAREPASELLARAAGRLIRETPSEVARTLDAGGLTPPAREVLVEALRAGGQAMESLLRRLATDPAESVQRAALAALHSLGPSAPPFLRIYSMGLMEVFRGAEKVPEAAWRTQKTRFLLAYVALAAGRPVHEERASAEFWPDSEAQGKNLTGTLSALRLCLRPSHWTGELDYLLRQRGQLAMNPALPRWHDVDELSAALAEWTRTRDRAACRRAVSLYRGPYLEDCYMDWALTTRTRLERSILDALWELVSSSDEDAELVGRLLELDPCHQGAYALQMRAHLQSGRNDLAVKAYERCERALRRELNLEPNLELLELRERARLNL